MTNKITETVKNLIETSRFGSQLTAPIDAVVQLVMADGVVAEQFQNYIGNEAALFDRYIVARLLKVPQGSLRTVAKVFYNSIAFVISQDSHGNCTFGVRSPITGHFKDYHCLTNIDTIAIDNNIKNLVGEMVTLFDGKEPKYVYDIANKHLDKWEDSLLERIVIYNREVGE